MKEITTKDQLHKVVMNYLTKKGPIDGQGVLKFDTWILLCKDALETKVPLPELSHSVLSTTQYYEVQIKFQKTQGLYMYMKITITDVKNIKNGYVKRVTYQWYSVPTALFTTKSTAS